MVRIGEAREEAWKKILWFGYLKGDSILMRACRTAAGKKWKVLEANLSIKEVRSLIIEETWCDSQFIGWKDIPLLGKILELRWRMRYKKIKMPRENFGEFEKCIWCEDNSSSSHIFLECNIMKSRL